MFDCFKKGDGAAGRSGAQRCSVVCSFSTMIESNRRRAREVELYISKKEGGEEAPQKTVYGCIVRGLYRRVAMAPVLLKSYFKPV